MPLKWTLFRWDPLAWVGWLARPECIAHPQCYFAPTHYFAPTLTTHRYQPPCFETCFFTPTHAHKTFLNRTIFLSLARGMTDALGGWKAQFDPRQKARTDNAAVDGDWGMVGNKTVGQSNQSTPRQKCFLFQIITIETGLGQFWPQNPLFCLVDYFTESSVRKSKEIKVWFVEEIWFSIATKFIRIIFIAMENTRLDSFPIFFIGIHLMFLFIGC